MPTTVDSALYVVELRICNIETRPLGGPVAIKLIPNTALGFINVIITIGE